MRVSTEYCNPENTIVGGSNTVSGDWEGESANPR